MTTTPKTLQDVPTSDLQEWLASVEKQLGPNCPTARGFRAELSRRRKSFTRVDSTKPDPRGGQHAR